MLKTGEFVESPPSRSSLATWVAPETVSMPNTSVLLRRDLAAVVHLDTEPFSPDWAVAMERDPRIVEDNLRQAGWRFIWVVPVMKASAFARGTEPALRKAVQKILTVATERGLNALEIKKVELRRILGFDRASVTAQLRNIQQSPYLLTTGGR